MMYGKIGDMRRIEIIVSKEGNQVYSGMVNDAPEEIKESHYKSIQLKSGKAYVEI